MILCKFLPYFTTDLDVFIYWFICVLICFADYSFILCFQQGLLELRSGYGITQWCFGAIITVFK